MVSIKVTIRLSGDYGTTYHTVTLEEEDLIKFAKQEALSHYQEGYYTEAECDDIDEVVVKN